MRDIQQRINKQCMVSGFLELWKDAGGDLTGVLLTTCTCEGFDGWTNREDHLWVYLPTEMFNRCMEAFKWTRLSKVSFAGTVAQYQRSNGSIDFGVNQDPSLIRWSVFRDKDLPELARWGDWRRIVQILESGKIYNDFSDLGRDDFLDDVSRCREWVSLQRPQEKKRLDSPMTLAIPSSKRPSSRGFG